MQIQTYQKRSGITLLFVVSMIVLFLLMGTTFVVVSNDYLRASRKRARVDVKSIDGDAYLDKALYDLIRGPELTNTTSPLRGQDLLSDQYGYGFRAYVTSSAVNGGQDPEFVAGSGNQLFRVCLASHRTDFTPAASILVNHSFNLLKPDDIVTPDPLTDVATIYNGLIFSFVSGPAAGISTRIVNHQIETVGSDTVHWFTLPVMEWNDGGNNVSLSSLVNSQIIVNGREFSGTGAGEFQSGVAAGTRALDAEALEPNRVGETLDELRNNYFGTTAPGAMYTNRAPNEPYDAADFQNMYLAGSSGGTLIPSFHRDSLATHLGSSDAGDSHMFAAFDDAPLSVDSNNDGTNDALWIDIGLPVQSNDQGIYFKPLVAYTVFDLDGRLNLNAHGNLTQISPNDFNHFIDASQPVNMLGSPNNLPRGQGWGPPEINLAAVLDNASATDEYASLLASRYGTDNIPGDGGVAGKSRARLFGHPFDFVDWSNNTHGTRGGLFASSPMDLHGRFSIGTPVNSFVNASNSKDRFRDLNFSGFSNGMPVIDMYRSSFTGREFTNSPYEMSFAPSPFNDSNDQPFSAQELEKIFRPNDIDSNLLPNRLFGIIGADEAATVTTDSYEIPLTYDLFLARLRIRIANENGYTLPAQSAQVDNVVNNLLGANVRAIAPELLRGLKLDVNRPLGNGYDDDGDGVVDEPDEAGNEFNIDQGNLPMDLDNDGIVNNSNEANARINLAKQLYLLAMVTTDAVPVDIDGDGNGDAGGYQRRLAQWAINVVEFRDPDSVMTRFEYDPNPWDGWTASQFVWGCERPELLITETFGAHARRTEDLDGDSGDSNDHDISSGNDTTFDQGLRPEPFAYFELYNPWTQNSLNQYQDADLYDNNQGVVLNRRSGGTGGRTSPIWRMSIDRPDRGSGSTEPLRFVYFGDPNDGGNDTVGDDNSPNVEVFYSDYNLDSLRPGTQAMVGSLGFEDPNNAGVYRNFMGRLSTKTRGDETADNLELDRTNHIGINPDNGEVTRFPLDPTNDPRFSVVVPVNFRRIGMPGSPASEEPFSVSDPFQGYPKVDFMGTPMTQIVNGDGFRYMIAYDDPLDSRPDTYRDADDISAVRTEDGMFRNFRIIKLQRLADPQQPWDANKNPYLTIDSMPLDLIAFNGVTNDAEPNLTPARNADLAESLERGAGDISATDVRTLWDSRRRRRALNNPSPTTGDHYFDASLTETLGKTNEIYTRSVSNKGFPWLAWNNRPYVSHIELMNVPYTSSEELTARFTIDDSQYSEVDNAYEGFNGGSTREDISGRFGHLLNFYRNDRDAGAGNASNFFQLMDYLEVPSRFLGTETNLNASSFARNPYNFLSRYRVPGKINLNTIYSSDVWDGLMNQYYSNVGGGCSWAEFTASRQGSNSGPTEFHNPFRPAGTGNYVPPGVDVAEGPDCTLFRQGAAAGEPLLDYTSTSAADDTGRSAYFRNAMRMRMGNLVTTRSSVFAIWITVGYFEVDVDGTLRPGLTGEGVELGSETGQVQRNRGFYIFDRSIPVAFEPGKNHNVDRGILVKSIIE